MNAGKNIQNLICKYKSFLHQYNLHRAIYTLPKQLDLKIDSDIVNYELKDYKKHPGRVRVNSPINLTQYLVETINRILSDHSVRALINEADTFVEFKKNRRLPLESRDSWKIIEQVEKDVYVDDLEKMRLTPEERVSLETFQEKQRSLKLEHKMYKWSPINYTQRLSLVYLTGYFASEYAIMKQIFSEIERRDVDFKPTHLFDLGSGVGSVMWAAHSTWKSDIKEYFNSDISIHMNQLSELILRGGDFGGTPHFKGVTYRQSFPASSKNQFELVTCAFTLFELSSFKSRCETLSILWNKVLPNGYLVLVEQNSIYGYIAIMEARNYILNELCDNELKNNEKIENNTDSNDKVDLPKGHVFSPCPHEYACPIKTDELKCTFRATYYPLKINGVKNDETALKAPYCYVIIKKSARNQDSKSWPRLVHRDPLKVNAVRHAWLCTKYGNFDHYISTKERSKEMNNLLKYSISGDLLPIDYPDSKMIRVEHKKLKKEIKVKSEAAHETNANNYEKSEKSN